MASPDPPVGREGRPLVEVERLAKHFWVRESRFQRPRLLRAVEDVSFVVGRGEVVGLVGESGCGKSTCGRAVLRILEPTGGRIRFDGQDITALSQRDLLPFRRRMMIIHQDPYGSLDPRMTVGRIIREGLDVHSRSTRGEKADRVVAMMEKVGLTPDQRDRYPHEFSGGQRQRIAIARALIIQPEFVVADEPVSALDVSIRAQIINLLRRLQEEMALGLLFVSHDLSVVRHLCDRILVMYLGRIVEVAPKRALFAEPRHPYTQALLAAVPVPDPAARRERAPLAGDIPNPLRPPAGCRFHPRCPQAQPICRETDPPLMSAPDGRAVACHLLR